MPYIFEGKSSGELLCRDESFTPFDDVHFQQFIVSFPLSNPVEKAPVLSLHSAEILSDFEPKGSVFPVALTLWYFQYFK